MEIALLCAYAGLLVHVSRRVGAEKTASSSAESFFVNSRSSSAWSVAFSLVVSCVGASATMGLAGMAFKVGTPAFWWLGSGAVGLTLLSLLLARKVRAGGFFTMPEMSGRLLGSEARWVISIIILIAWTAILAAQFSALSKLLAMVTGWEPLLCLGAGIVLVVVHTMGGQAVVIRTDRIQFFILAGGLCALLSWLHHSNPGWTAGVRLEAVNKHFTAGELMRYLFVIGGNYLVCPMLFGRFLSARSGHDAVKGGLLAVVGILFCAAIIVAVGLGARGAIPENTPADAVLTTAVDNLFPWWLSTLVLLSLLSAVVSSADSCLVTSATVLSHDLLHTGRTAYCRVCVVVLGLLGAAMTFMDRDILSFLLMAYDVYVAGVVMPVFVALLMAGGRSVSPAYSIPAVVGGGGLGLMAAISGDSTCSIAGMTLSCGITLIGVLRAGKAEKPSP